MLQQTLLLFFHFLGFGDRSHLSEDHFVGMRDLRDGAFFAAVAPLAVFGLL